MATETQPTLSDVLGQLITFDANNRAVWPTEQLRTLLAQHLHTPLPISGMAQSMTFAQLLQHPRPPIDLLRETKDFAKRNVHSHHSMIPPELCLVLYYASIIVALLRRSHRISKLSDQDLFDGLNWAARQTWVDDNTRSLFQQGKRLLGGSVPSWR